MIQKCSKNVAWPPTCEATSGRGRRGRLSRDAAPGAVRVAYHWSQTMRHSPRRRRPRRLWGKILGRKEKGRLRTCDRSSTKTCAVNTHRRRPRPPRRRPPRHPRQECSAQSPGVWTCRHPNLQRRRCRLHGHRLRVERASERTQQRQARRGRRAAPDALTHRRKGRDSALG